jgi:16S rRNA (cytidine1402-2'-O)-methyltransferase
MPGTLYVVATPIGNLEDITLRALRILREVSLIAAEDTRRTARLLQHYSISTRTTSLHEHNEQARSGAIIAKLLAGESVALVSDAGTPGVSDPGSHLVTIARQAGIKVEAIPGPNAAVAAVSASGLGASEFVFAGFPPSRSFARKQWFRRFAADDRPLVLYEAPHRIRQTLQDMLVELGDRPIWLARELTKIHETMSFGQISILLESLGEPRGEYTVVVSGAGQSTHATAPLPQAAALRLEYGDLTKIKGVPRREALRRLAERYGTSTREIYRTVLGRDKSVE